MAQLNRVIELFKQSKMYKNFQNFQDQKIRNLSKINGFVRNSPYLYFFSLSLSL